MGLLIGQPHFSLPVLFVRHTAYQDRDERETLIPRLSPLYGKK